jgi:hypothetical protein
MAADHPAEFVAQANTQRDDLQVAQCPQSTRAVQLRAKACPMPLSISGLSRQARPRVG